MAFLLPNGQFNVNDVGSFLTTNYGSYEGLRNANTPESKEMLKRLNNLQSLRNQVATKAGPEGKLTDDQMKQLRTSATGISEARLAAQKSQMADPNGKVDANAKTPTVDPSAKDPYKESNGKKYRAGPSDQDVRSKGKQFSEGDKGDGVKALQKQLLEAGYNLGPKGADGFFGPKTATAAKEFLGKNKDLTALDKRGLERVAGTVEGIRSTKGTGLDAR